MGHVSFRRKQRTDVEMLNSFTKTFGSPSRTVVAIGDYGANRTMKYQVPTKGKSMRDLFHRRGFTVLLVDEHGTSKLCAACGSECMKLALLLATRSPRQWRRAIAAAGAAHVQQYPLYRTRAAEVHGMRTVFEPVR